MSRYMKKGEPWEFYCLECSKSICSIKGDIHGFCSQKCYQLYRTQISKIKQKHKTKCYIKPPLDGEGEPLEVEEEQVE